MKKICGLILMLFVLVGCSAGKEVSNFSAETLNLDGCSVSGFEPVGLVDDEEEIGGSGYSLRDQNGNEATILVSKDEIVYKYFTYMFEKAEEAELDSGNSDGVVKNHIGGKRASLVYTTELDDEYIGVALSTLEDGNTLYINATGSSKRKARKNLDALASSIELKDSKFEPGDIAELDETALERLRDIVGGTLDGEFCIDNGMPTMGCEDEFIKQCLEYWWYASFASYAEMGVHLGYSSKQDVLSEEYLDKLENTLIESDGEYEKHALTNEEGEIIAELWFNKNGVWTDNILLENDPESFMEVEEFEENILRDEEAYTVDETEQYIKYTCSNVYGGYAYIKVCLNSDRKINRVEMHVERGLEPMSDMEVAHSFNSGAFYNKYGAYNRVPFVGLLTLEEFKELTGIEELTEGKEFKDTKTYSWTLGENKGIIAVSKETGIVVGNSLNVNIDIDAFNAAFGEGTYNKEKNTIKFFWMVPGGKILGTGKLTDDGKTIRETQILAYRLEATPDGQLGYNRDMKFMSKAANSKWYGTFCTFDDLPCVGYMTLDELEEILKDNEEEYKRDGDCIKVSKSTIYADEDTGIITKAVFEENKRNREEVEKICGPGKVEGNWLICSRDIEETTIEMRFELDESGEIAGLVEVEAYMSEKEENNDGLDWLNKALEK